jgi:AcrR family transcriptional regulator
MIIDDSSKEMLTQRQELRQQIVKTALSLFTTHGIKGITMDEIAAAMGISKRTLYEVFSDKETLLLECMEYSKADTNEYMRKVLEQSHNVMEVLLKLYEVSLEQLHKVNRKFFEDIKRYPRVNAEIERRRYSEAEEKIAFYRLGVKQGFFRDDINYEIMNALVLTQLDLLINKGSELLEKYPFREVYEAIMFTYIRGITTDAGLQMLDIFIQNYRNNQNKQ